MRSLALSLVLLSACRTSPDSAATPDAAPPIASVAPVASAKPAAKAAHAAEPKPTRSTNAEYTLQLKRGRALATDKKWPEAVTAFEAALVANPNDGRALAELGYAAYGAGDYAKAHAVNTRALGLSIDPKRKAQVLFNEGLVEEKQNHPELARARYAASLALRPNTIVAKRLAALAAPPGPCEGAFVDVAALCTCLIAQPRDTLMIADDDVLECSAQKLTVPAALTIVRWGPQEGLGEHPWLAAAKGKDGWRQVADVGDEYEPGAFGIHNEAKVEKVEARTIGHTQLAIVTWSQDNADSDMAGLIRQSHSEKNATICVLGDVPRCDVVVPLEETDALDYPLELDADDTEGKATLADMKREHPATTSTALADYSIDDAGVLRLTHVRGTSERITALAKGVKLW